jgi:pimeloyl-ACP methyl ester carboxylesterase
VAALLAVATIAAGLALAVFFAQDKLIFFPQPLSPAQREAIQTQYPGIEQRFLEAHDGTRLHAWHVKGAAGAPIVLYFGGNAEEVSWMIRDVSARTPGLGWLLTSYRGYGASEGAPSERALSADALQWYDYAAGELGAKAIHVFGRSLGSGPAVHVASRRQVAGVVLVTPFDSLVEVGKRHYPWLPVAWMLRHRFDLVKVAPRIKSPLLCIAAMQDDVIPAAHAKRLYDAWGGPRQWLALEGAGHNSTDGVPAFWQGIVAFLQESRF